MTSVTGDWLDRDLEFEEDEAEESSADLNLSEEKFSNLLVAPADWTIETLYSQIGKQIELDPDFQRRNVWNSRSKSRFIESLMLGIPIPQILLSAKPNSKSAFLVLDGKQRLLTIKEFIDGKLPNNRTFRLKDLRVLSDLEGKSWQDIQKDPDTAAKLLNETQRTTVLRGWSDESVLYEIFYRLNSGSVKLSPMELRMSLYPGEFLKFVLRWTEVIGPVHRLLKKRTPDPRMGDVELAIRFLAFTDKKTAYKGDLKKFLDKICEDYNVNFREKSFEIEIQERLNQLNFAIDAGFEEFGQDFCKKYFDGKYESRFNRAIFDIMSYAFSYTDFRSWTKKHPGVMKAKFEELCQKDSHFIRSIETTTKSETATRTRFESWINLCNTEAAINIAPPHVG